MSQRRPVDWVVALGRSILCTLCALCAVYSPAQSPAPSIRPAKLRCEYRVNPLGIDARQPRLSWIAVPLDPTARGLKQSAYRIVAASNAESLRRNNGDLWDSGKVVSDQSIQVVYGGKPLQSGVRAFWKVQVWDQAGRPSGWSEAAHWSMGLLQPGDWKATWIGRDETGVQKPKDSPFSLLEKAQWIWFPAGDPAKAAPAGARFFRATIEIPAGRTIRRALLVIAADGDFEVFVAGARSARGAGALMPSVLEIASLLRPGTNTLAIRATHSGSNKPAGLIGALRVEFTPSEPLVLATGSEWRSFDSETPGWETASFAAAWPAAKVLGSYGMAPWGEVGFSEARVLPARMLRKEFPVRRGLQRATAYLCGLGLSELYLNGRRVGDDVLSPGLTEYEKRALYVTYDVTPYLVSGRNAAGVILGNGRYYAPRDKTPTLTRTFGFPKLLFQLHLEYRDGSSEMVVSDETWKLTTGGPIRANNEYDGEEYDARLERDGWNRPGFDDASWEPARVVRGPAGVLAAQMSEPIRVTETLRPAGIRSPKPGVWVFDMGQNLVGWCRLKVSGPKGTRVTLRHAETLDPSGLFYVANLRSAAVTDSYILKGGGTEVWEPRFTYHGFRYVELTGFPGKPTLDTIQGRVVHDALEPAGRWVTSNRLLNQIHHNIVWGTRGNYRSIPTDCPQRDERQGWLGDRSWESKGESYLFNIAPLYSKWVTDMADSQRADGSIPDVAPAYWPLYNNSVTWPGTFVIIPGTLYEQYGDRRVLERNYPEMKKWIDFMRGFLKDGLMPRDVYGDWCVPPESPELIHSKDPARQTEPGVLGTTWFYDLLIRMARYATLLGRPADAGEFQQLAGRMKDAFHKKFFRPETSQYSNGSQTSSILPLAFGMTPPESRRAVFDALTGKIQTETHAHVGTGLVGGQWLMRVLSDNGRPDLAYTIATQTGYPSWGYMIEHGATTVWELWNGDTADPAMNSGNHVMLVGDLNIWFYEYLAGIRPDPGKPGFQRFSIKPYPVGDLTSVDASYNSIHGEIASRWKREGSSFSLHATVPANTSATIYLPAGQTGAITESGKPAAEAPGVKYLRWENGAAVFSVESGSYSFASRL